MVTLTQPRTPEPPYPHFHALPVVQSWSDVEVEREISTKLVRVVATIEIYHVAHLRAAPINNPVVAVKWWRVPSKNFSNISAQSENSVTGSPRLEKSGYTPKECLDRRLWTSILRSALEVDELRTPTSLRTPSPLPLQNLCPRPLVHRVVNRHYGLHIHRIWLVVFALHCCEELCF